MEIDLYRDDGIVHVITTGVSYVDDVLWVSTYFGVCRYDGRHWRGFYDHETGLPSNFNNNVKAPQRQRGLVLLATRAWASSPTSRPTPGSAYTRDPKTRPRQGQVIRRGKVARRRSTCRYDVPHNFIICVDFDGNDVWVGTARASAGASARATTRA